MKKLLPVILFLSLFAIGTRAQDVHFSQFNASPLTLNPALAGKVECTYRAALNYRNQWNSVPAPYVTYSASFDAALGKNSWANGSALGVGLLLLNDKSGDGNLTAPNVGLFLAYHQKIGNGSFLSAGFEGSFNEKRIDQSQLIFPNQIGPNGVDPFSASGEALLQQIQYFDVNAGIHWSTVVSDNFSFNLGGAVYHIVQPNESFYGNPNNKLYRRYVGHGGFSVMMNKKYSLSPSVLYMQQGNVDQMNAGTSFGIHYDDAAVYFGTWYRLHILNDPSISQGPLSSVIALLGVEFNTLALGFSYDITTSSLSPATNGKGGFELSLQYTGCIAKQRKVMACPRF